MQDCKPLSTPSSPVTTNDVEDTPLSDQMRSHYRSLVGSLIYAAVISRPDIAYSVNQLCKKMEKPTKSDWTAAKHVLRYLRGTTALGLTFHQNGNSELIGYSDADWAGDVQTRRSTSGFVFILAGAAISWISKQQSIVALSSTEAEYIAMSKAVQEALYLRQLLRDLGHHNGEKMPPTLLLIDNQGAIKMGEGTVSMKRTKHIDIRFHFIRDAITNGYIKCKYLPTEDMVADCLTKAVSRPMLLKTLKLLMG